MKILIFFFSHLLLLTHVFAKECFSKESTYKSEGSDGFEIQTIDYLPTESQGHIIIVPPTGGTNILDRSYARGFCAAGFTTHILSHWSDDNEWNLELEIHTRFYARANRAIETLVKTIPANSFIGILGTSVGGLHAAIAASRFPEIKAAFIITGGAHIPGVIAHSTQDAMIEAWEYRKKRYGFKTKEEYVSALEKVIKLEPLDLSQSGKALGLSLGEKDKVVPTLNQYKLRDLWRPQKIISFNRDHFLTIVFTWLFKEKEITEFFKKANIPKS